MDLPMFEDRKRMWSNLRVRRRASSPSAERYATALRTVYDNGDVRTATFAVDEHEVFDWYLSRNAIHDMGFFAKFWGLDPVASLMPEPLTDLNFYSRDVFEGSSPFLLGGSLARALALGGPYETHREGPSHAKSLGDAVAADWIEERYDDVLVYESHTAWSDFFLDVAWDHTWVVLDKTRRLVHLLCATDTD